MFADFLNWTGWEAIGVFVSTIIGILTLWLTVKLQSKRDTKTLNETRQSTSVIDRLDGKAYSSSVRKTIVVGSLIIIGIIAISSTVQPQSKQTIQSAPVIDTVDGQAYNPSVHKNIVALVVYHQAVNGQNVFGFTSLQKAQKYEQDHLNDQQEAHGGYTYFYEHVSFDRHKLGNKLPVRIGTSVSYVGNLWNDEISSVDVHPQSTVRVYKDRNYKGPHITFVNNGNSDSHWFIDLSSYNFPGSVYWNDCISSIRTWNINL